MLYKATSYIRYLLKSTNLHGIHSPFVFDLVKNCIYDKTEYPEYALIDRFKNRMLESKEEVLVRDYGAGKDRTQRKISHIAGIASSDEKKAKLLFRLANYFKPEKILELGTNLGVGTYSLSLGSTDSKVVSIEGDPSLFAIASSNLSQIKKIRLLNNKFDDVLSDLVSKENPDFVFIDGNHRYKPTVEYFEILASNATDDTILIFDDIYWSEEMTKAFRYIQTSNKVSVTVDLYRVGLVFFKRGQKKQDFIVRF